MNSALRSTAYGMNQESKAIIKNQQKLKAETPTKKQKITIAIKRSERAPKQRTMKGHVSLSRSKECVEDRAPSHSAGAARWCAACLCGSQLILFMLAVKLMTMVIGAIKDIREIVHFIHLAQQLASATEEAERLLPPTLPPSAEQA